MSTEPTVPNTTAHTDEPAAAAGASMNTAVDKPTVASTATVASATSSSTELDPDYQRRIESVSDDESDEDAKNLDLRQADDIIVNERGQRVFRFWNGDVTKTIIREGHGRRPTPGATVHCHYVGTLEDGSKFDSSRDRNTPFTFTVGVRQVIQAWDAAMMTMVPGELAIIKTTSQYAYGDMGAPGIPEKATLIFEVELLSWEPVTKPIAPGIKKCLITRGPGWRQVVLGTKLWMTIKGSWTDSEDQEQIFLNVTEPIAVDLDDPKLSPGLETALCSMNPGETSKFWIVAGLVGDGYLPELHTPGPFKIRDANMEVEYEINIVRADLPKENWELDKPEKVALGTKLRLAGNTFFSMGAYTRAVARYTAVCDLFEYETDLDGAIKAEAESLVAAAQLNKATALIKLKSYPEAINACNEVIRVQPNSVKAWYKKAEAEAMLNNLSESKRCLEKALTLPGQSENADVKRLLAVVEERIARHEQREKAIWGAAARKAGMGGLF